MASPTKGTKGAAEKKDSRTFTKKWPFFFFSYLQLNSRLARIILKINHLLWFCFVQYHSLQPLLHEHAHARVHSNIFC